MKKTRVFQTKKDTPMMFFTIVQWTTDHGTEDTVEFRQYVLDWLAKKGHMERVYDTERTEDQIVKDWQDLDIGILDLRKKKEE